MSNLRIRHARSDKKAKADAQNSQLGRPKCISSCLLWTGFSNHFDGFLLNIYNFAWRFLDSWLGNDFVKITLKFQVCGVREIIIEFYFPKISCRMYSKWKVEHFHNFHCGFSSFHLHSARFCWSNLKFDKNVDEN